MAKKKAAKKHKSKAAPASKPHKKKESNKFLVWAVVVVVIVVLLFLIRGVKDAPEAPAAQPEAPAETEATPEEEAPVEEVEEEVDTVPETAPGESLVEEGDLESGEYSKPSLIGNPQYKDESLGKDLTAEPERFSNFECKVDEDGMTFISLKVTNTNSDEAFLISHEGVKKGYNTYFMVNGLTDKDPGCGVEELASGESTVCDNVGLPKLVLDGINRLTIQSPNDGGKMTSEAVVVNCEE